MWYIFNASGKCLSSCDSAPNTEDLATREEIAVESDVLYNIARIQRVGDVIREKQSEDTAPTDEEEPADEERLALYEAMAAQEARLDELEAAIKNLKGGE